MTARWLALTTLYSAKALLRSGPMRSATRLFSVAGPIYDSRDPGAPAVTLFTKEGCTLCDSAKEVLEAAAQERPHTLEAVDISDPENAYYWGRYKYDIPVLTINGIYWAKHRCA